MLYESPFNRPDAAQNMHTGERFLQVYFRHLACIPDVFPKTVGFGGCSPPLMWEIGWGGGGGLLAELLIHYGSLRPTGVPFRVGAQLLAPALTYYGTRCLPVTDVIGGVGVPPSPPPLL